jgi:hypothetical protein
MIRKGLILSDSWPQLGALLATQSDEDQAAFLKAFVKECHSWETNRQAEMQMVYISKHLTDEEKDLLSGISYKGDGA